MKNLLPARSFNFATPKGRLFRAGATGVSKLLSRGLSVLAGLLVLPLTAQYLGTDRFGLWLILGTFLTWAGIADLGLSNSLTNILATAEVAQNKRQAQEATSSAFFLILGIVLGLLGLSIWIFTNAPLDSWFNLTSLPDASEAHLAILVCCIIFVLRLPLTIPNKIYNAYQEGYLYEFWYMGSSLASIFSIAIAIYFKTNLAILLLSFFGVQLLGDVGAATHIFRFRRPWLMPQLRFFRWHTAKHMISKSFQIWIAQISAILLYQTDLFIILKLFNASEVASYGLLLRLFTLIAFIPSSFVNALWSAYSEAQARADYLWINQTLRKSIVFSLAWSVTLSAGLMLIAQKIVAIWLNPNIILPINLLLAMSITTILSAVSQCIGTLINGLGATRLQALIGPVSAISNLILSVILARHLGTSGVAWASAITIAFSLLILGNDIIKKTQTLAQQA